LLLKARAFARAPLETLQRRQLARDYNASAARAILNHRKGFGLLSSGYFPDFERVRSTCVRLFEIKRTKIANEVADVASWDSDAQMKFRASKRKFLRNLLNNEDLRRNPELLDFALSDASLGIATTYLGMVPRLNRIDLLYSVPRGAEDGPVASQLFHVDPEGPNQVKFFINLFEVGESEGPFTFIPADDTSRILQSIRSLRRRTGKADTVRYTDEEIATVGGHGAIMAASGPPGTGVAIDTSRCLHFGSRVRTGSFRLCLYLQYCTSPETGNVFETKKFRRDPIRFLAVAHSRASVGTELRAPHEVAD
jgi:hypothetical protein